MRLLQQAIRLFSILSFVVLLAGVPCFYFLLRATVNEEVDEELIADKARIVQYLNRLPDGTNVLKVPFVDVETHLEADTSSFVVHSRFHGENHFSTYKKYDSIIDEVFSIRVMKTKVKVHGTPYLLTVQTSMVDHNDLVQIVVIAEVVLLIVWLLGMRIINKKVSAAYLLQKEFTENAAHEMQTPLAVFQSKLELLMQTSPINSAQADLIEKMADASQRLNRLNKALVTLTRLDNHQFADRETVDLQNIMARLLEEYQEAFVQKNISLVFHRNARVMIEANKTLTEILVSNLLSNAIRHNVQDGSVHIILNEKELIVKNTGVSHALDSLRLFQRFYKDSDDERSTGLGLEIMYKICAVNHYVLKYHYENSTHQFSVRL